MIESDKMEDERPKTTLDS